MTLLRDDLGDPPKVIELLEEIGKVTKPGGSWKDSCSEWHVEKLDEHKYKLFGTLTGYGGSPKHVNIEFSPGQTFWNDNGEFKPE